jgi:glycerol-3-phosphate dehydrogenase
VSGERVEPFDVFVIGGGGTGSEVALRLGRTGGIRIGLAERATSSAANATTTDASRPR